jgi:hypothetical protein
MANRQFYYNMSKYGMQGMRVEFAAKNCMDFCTRQMASQQLKSGDLCINAQDASQAKLIRHYAEKWVCGFRKEAMVRKPT